MCVQGYHVLSNDVIIGPALLAETRAGGECDVHLDESGFAKYHLFRRRGRWYSVRRMMRILLFHSVSLCWIGLCESEHHLLSFRLLCLEARDPRHEKNWNLSLKYL